MSTPAANAHTRWQSAVLVGVVGSLVVAFVVLAFLWPSKTSSPHNLPISIAGPAAGVTALEGAVAERAPDIFDFVAATDRADAVSQIERRETYGAIVVADTPTTAPEVLTAPAGSAVAAQLLSQLAAQLQGQLTQQAAAAGVTAPVTVTVTPVVPLVASDSAGSGLAAASFPLTIGGMIGGILISLTVVGAMRRLAALAGFAAAVGVVLTLVLQTWFEYIQGDFWVNALAFGLSVLATSALIVGCASLFGRAGIAIGSVLTLFVGNPLSAAAVPWQFLLEPWGAIGQMLVPGASNTLIRTLSYFPSADAGAQWWILIAWVALGVVLTLAGHFRSQAPVHVPEATLEEDPAYAERRRSVAVSRV